MILPNQATIYIDTVSTFADGREAKQTYSLDWSEIDGQMIMKKQNEINGEEISQSQLEEGNKNYILFTSGKEEDTDLVIRDLSEMSEEETSKMLIDNGQIQTGEQIKVSKIENSFQKLSPEAKTKYEMLSWMKIIIPILYCILGVWASAYIFYRSKIAAPIATLEEAAGKIAKQALARILENLVQNSMRYAKKQIRVVLEEAKQATERTLCITVSDDGKGYPQKVLQQKDLYFYTTEEGAHMGMGMVVSRILARKHGGELKLMNAESGGAKTQIIIKELTNI